MFKENDRGILFACKKKVWYDEEDNRQETAGYTEVL